MPSSYDTGHGATVTLATSALTLKLRQVGESAKERPRVDISTLDLTGFMKHLPGDLDDPGEVELEFLFDTGVNSPACGVVETITLTAPTATGQNNAAKLAGSGFIRKVTNFPPCKTNEVQIGKLTFAWDGTNGPTFTPAT